VILWFVVLFPLLACGSLHPSSPVHARTSDSSVCALGRRGPVVVHWVAFSDSSIVASSRQVSSEHTFVLPVFSDVEAQRQEIRLGKCPVEDVTDAAVIGNCLFCLPLVSPDSVISELAMLVSKHKGTLSDGWITSNRWNVNVGTSCSQQLFLQFFCASMILISSTIVH
jgi:hypothetical protein